MTKHCARCKEPFATAGSQVWKKRYCDEACARAAQAERAARGDAPARKNPMTVDVDYSADELELLKAVDAYRRRENVKFPTAVDVLKVMRSLGYRKIQDGAAAGE